MEVGLNQKTQMQEFSSADLLFLISCRENEEDAHMAKDAFNEFFKRFKNYIFHIVRKHFSYNKEINNNDKMGYVHDVFLKVWENADQFNPDVSKDGSLDDQIKAWLGTIARNLVIDYFRDQGRIHYVTFSNEDKTQNLVPVETNEKYIELPLTFQEERLEQALRDLSERELDILFTYLTYRNMRDIMDSSYSSGLENDEKKIVISIWGYNPTDSIHYDSQKPKKGYTDSEAIDLLVNRYQTTRENIRQIYSRTLKKLKKNLYNQE